MSPDDEDAAASEPVGDGEGGRVLLCPDEWDDPAGRKVIDEYHKAGLPTPPGCENPDHGPTGGRWDMKTFTKMASEYHKEGAPFVESRSTRDGYLSPEKVAPAIVAPGEVRAGGQQTGVGGVSASVEGVGDDGGEDGDDDGGDVGAEDGEGSPSRAAGEPDGRTASSFKTRLLNVTTLEMLMLGLFRVLFGKGVRIPIRVPDRIDMDLIVMDRDIILNTNSVRFVVPDFKFWHFTYAYKGKPVMEMGRGVRGRVNIHFWNLFVFAVALLRGSRKAKKELARAEREAQREMVRLASRGRAGDGTDRGDDR